LPRFAIASSGSSGGKLPETLRPSFGDCLAQLVEIGEQGGRGLEALARTPGGPAAGVNF
jgi:hypothetical protein